MTSNGNISALYDYYPYGDARIVNEIASNSNYRYTSKELDKETDLHYYEQRYYDQKIGKFNRIDPLFFKIALAAELKEITGQKQQKFLENPQAFNSYSYTQNNPVKYVDPDGEFAGQFGRDMASGQRTIANFLHQAADYTSNRGGILNEVSGFVTNALADTVDNVANVYDPDQNAGTRGVALLLTVLDTGTGGEGKVIGKVAGGLKLGQSFGKLGRVAENVAGKMSSLDQHALARMEKRGVTVDLMKKVVSNPLVTLKQAGERTLYLTREAAVVLDKTGRAITTYTKNEFKPHILNVFKSIKY